MQQQQTTDRPPISPRDPAVQVVDSAYQIITMIGANPRAIRPILAQRRLTKEQVLDAVASATERTAIMLAELDGIAAERRAEHDLTVTEISARIAAWGADPTGATAPDGEPAEVTHLRSQLAAANAAISRLQAEQRGPRQFCARLQERTTRVGEVYATL